jgi:hypothetical protein
MDLRQRSYFITQVNLVNLGNERTESNHRLCTTYGHLADKTDSFCGAQNL